MTTQPRRTSFLDAIGSGVPQIGIWSCAADPLVVEICAGSGFDWVLIDGEHGPTDVRGVLAQLQAAAAYPVAPLVRPPVGDAVRIKQLLDVGARNLLIPMVDTAEQAAAVASAATFPPDGVRGVASQTRGGRWGRQPGYLQSARDELCVIVQIETRAGLANAEAIIGVDGVDAVFVGPADLAASLGHLGRPDHPDVVEAIERVRALAAEGGKPVGILTLDETLARQYVRQGFGFVGVGIDTQVLGSCLSRLCNAFRS